MKSILIFLAGFELLACAARADNAPSPNNAAMPASSATPAPLSQAAVDRLVQSNRELLDLLKKQQEVLSDIQVDRRLQDRRIQTLEERLTETLLQNSQLQAQISKLQAAPPVPAPSNATPSTNAAPVATVAPAPPPSTYLPPPEAEGAPGTLSWHRLFTLSGQDTLKSDLFHIQSKHWRVLWHNQDKPDAAHKNTSGLFIDAFPKDDTIPQKVCAKVGSGGDSTELVGPGNYYLKVDASGGSWELAVEEFR